MALPEWMNDVIATPRGFINKDGKLVKPQRMTAEQCDKFNNRNKVNVEEPKTIVLKIEEEAAVVEESTQEIIQEVKEESKVHYLSSSNIKKMNKAKLEEYGRSIGIELDRRKSKSALIKDLLAFINDK